MKEPKRLLKTGGNGEQFWVDNPDYGKRKKPSNLTPKKKKRK